MLHFFHTHRYCFAYIQVLYCEMRAAVKMEIQHRTAQLTDDCIVIVQIPRHQKCAQSLAFRAKGGGYIIVFQNMSLGKERNSECSLTF